MKAFSLVLGLVVLLSLAGRLPAAEPLPDGVAATVNGEAIPQRLVDTFLRNDQEGLEINPATGEGRQRLGELRGHIVTELIERALIAQGVRELGLTPTEAQIDAAERPMREFSVTEERYQAFLAQNGFNRQEYRDRVLRPAANGEVLAAALTKDLAVSDDEVKTYYEAHRADADLQWFERVTGAHLLIGVQPGLFAERLARERGLQPGPELDAAVAEEIERRRRLAGDLRQRAAAPGADFAALAREFSEDLGTREAGGSLGTFARGAHPTALDDAFLTLPPGEVGPVVQTPFGFHVPKVLDHRPAGPRTLAEATPEIRHRLLQSRRGELLREWLKAARARAVVVTPPAGAASEAVP